MTTLNPKDRDLREEERSALWQDVAQEIQQASPATRHQAATNPIMNIFTTTAAKGALALFVALGLIGGGAAADASKPGDALHGADLALEKVRLALATSAEAKSNLRVRFAEERVEELDELLDEDPGTPDTEAYVNAQAAIALAIEHLEAARAEADANENTDAALALDAVINRLNDRFAQLPDSAEYRVELRHRDDDDDHDHGARVEFRSEDDDDDTGFFVDDDGRVVRINKRVRVRLPISVDASKFFDDHDDDDEHEEDETRLEIEVDIFSTYSTVEAHIGEFESKFRVEETEKEALIAAIAAELEISEDDVRSIISFEMEDEEDDEHDEDRDHDDDGDEDAEDDGKAELEIDVDVFDGFSDVQVHMNDEERKFRVDSDVEAEIVAAIAAELGITEAEVIANMDLDVKTSIEGGDDHEEDDDGLLNNLL